MIRYAVACLALSAFPALGQHELPPLRYEPNATVAWEAAVKSLQDLNIRAGEMTLDGYPYPHNFSTRRPELKLVARLYHLELLHGAGADPAAPRRIPYEAMTRLGVVSDFGHRGVSIDGKWYVWCVRITDTSRRDACARTAADYLYALKGRADFVRQSDARFQETLAKYREPGGRPDLSEEARKYKVQAELAVERKRLADAGNAYVMAVRVAPWWAEGYYNLALIKGELKEYEDAGRMMRRFLALEPQSPHARAAQDQIYRWEALDAEAK